MERFRIKDLPKIERPREKLIQKGPQNFKSQLKLDKIISFW